MCSGASSGGARARIVNARHTSTGLTRAWTRDRIKRHRTYTLVSNIFVCHTTSLTIYFSVSKLKSISP